MLYKVRLYCAIVGMVIPMSMTTIILNIILCMVLNYIHAKRIYRYGVRYAIFRLDE